MVEAASGKRLADFLDERLFKPLKMQDTGVLGADGARWDASPSRLRSIPPSGQPNKVIDVSQEPKNDSGGAGGVSTAADYLRFAQMLLNGGQLDGARVLSRTTVALMTSDHLGTRIAAPITPERASARHARLHVRARLCRAPGRRRRRRARIGRRIHVGRLCGTYFWVDPKEELVAVYMSQAPSPQPRLLPQARQAAGLRSHRELSDGGR